MQLLADLRRRSAPLFVLALTMSRIEGGIPKVRFKAAVQALAPEARLGTIKATAEALTGAVDAIRSTRARRRPRRARAAPSRIWLQPASYETRLAERTRAAALPVARATFRHGAAGGGSMEVGLTREPSEVGYQVEIGRDYDTYRGQYKGWAARVDHHEITLPRRWLRVVHRRGLAVLDGLMTLDLAPLVSPVEDVELYAAVWAQQGRGYDVRTERGYIARGQDGRTYHGETADAAVRGVLRKAAASTRPRRGALAIGERVDRWAKAFGRVVMTAADAYEVGACRYGVQSWCEHVGLDAGGSATLAEVAAGWRAHPAPEAVEAMRRVVARERRRRREAAPAGRPGGAPPKERVHPDAFAQSTTAASSGPTPPLAT